MAESVGAPMNLLQNMTESVVKEAMQNGVDPKRVARDIQKSTIRTVRNEAIKANGLAIADLIRQCKGSKIAGLGLIAMGLIEVLAPHFGFSDLPDITNELLTNWKIQTGAATAFGIELIGRARNGAKK